MWHVVVGLVKKLFGGGGATQLGVGNQAITVPGAGSSVIAAGRDIHVAVSGHGIVGQKTEEQELREWLRQHAYDRPLTQLLPRVRRLAQIMKNTEVQRWANMELLGYSRENGMRDGDVVPKYRTVVGLYRDHYDRILQLDADMSFVNEYRFRTDVAMLEEFAGQEDFQNISDPAFLEKIRRDLRVDVSRFCFSPIAVRGVVNAIRSQAIEKLQTLGASDGVAG
jgi:hypothetical protein